VTKTQVTNEGICHGSCFVHIFQFKIKDHIYIYSYFLDLFFRVD